MRTIHKYILPLPGTFTLDLPEGAQLLSFQSQYNQPTLWALVDPAAPLCPRSFRLYGTGHPISEPDLTYIGTRLMEDDSLVWHLFEIT